MVNMANVDVLDNQLETINGKLSALRTNIKDIESATDDLTESSVSDVQRDIAEISDRIGGLGELIDEVVDELSIIPELTASALENLKQLPKTENAADEYLLEDCMTLFNIMKNKPRSSQILKSFIDRANLL